MTFEEEWKAAQTVRKDREAGNHWGVMLERLRRQYAEPSPKESPGALVIRMLEARAKDPNALQGMRPMSDPYPPVRVVGVVDLNPHDPFEQHISDLVVLYRRSVNTEQRTDT